MNGGDAWTRHIRVAVYERVDYTPLSRVSTAHETKVERNEKKKIPPKPVWENCLGMNSLIKKKNRKLTSTEKVPAAADILTRSSSAIN